MIRIAIVDDEKEHSNMLIKHLATFFQNSTEPHTCTVFTDAIDLLEHYSFCFDIIFLDIDMKFSNGMEAAKKLRKIDSKVLLVFETHLAQYAVDGYLVDATGYLVKPIEYYSVVLVMTKALSALVQNRKTCKIVVMEDERKLVIDSSEIRYIEVLDHMLIYHTVHGDGRDWTSLNQREKELVPYSFFRCHRCYLVNLKYVTGIGSVPDMVLMGKDSVPLSRGKKSGLMIALRNCFDIGVVS